MTIIISLDQCKAISLDRVMALLKNRGNPRDGGMWSIKNEIKPSDLYCYLYAKFGSPNGIQNLLRNDNSDNLIHWDWTLEHQNGLIVFLGLNMRTEVHLIGAGWQIQKCHQQQLVDYIRRDFANHGKQMSEVRSKILEDWDLISNPYKQLRKSIYSLKRELDSLALAPEKEQLSNFSPGQKREKYETDLTELHEKYSKGVGLAMAIRSMTPILAESFLNMLLFILCRPDIKENERLYTNAVRSNIDIKVQSLHINCLGFKQAVDWKSEFCAKYNTVINERNDMLHGNIVPEKLKFSEIYFNGKVPVFKEYKSVWQQSIGVSIEASGLAKVAGDLETVENFIEYVTSCIDDVYRDSVKYLITRTNIGVSKKNKRLAALLPEHIVDFWCPLLVEDNPETTKKNAEIVDEYGAKLNTVSPHSS